MRPSIRQRRLLLQLLAVLAAAALVAAACGGDDDETGGSGDEPDGAAAAPEPTAAPEPPPEPYRVALLIPGTSDDASWSNAWADGAAAADAANDDVIVEIVEALPEVDDFIQQGGAFAGDGYDLILMADGRMVDAARTVAEQFPETVVCQIPHQPESTDGNPDNLCYVDVAQHHANFFTGAIAALVSDTGRVASINGFAFPGLTRQPETFHLGARCVNPGIEFSQQYINTWTDTAAAKAAAQAEIAAPELLPGGRVQREGHQLRGEAVEDAADHQRAGVHQPLRLPGVVHPSELQLADVGRIDLRQRRVVPPASIAEIDGPVDVRRRCRGASGDSDAKEKRRQPSARPSERCQRASEAHAGLRRIGWRKPDEGCSLLVPFRN